MFASILSLLSSFLSSLLSSFLSFCSCVCLSFYLFAPAFFVCPLVLCLSSLSLWVVVVSFSLSVYTQKERAHRVGTSSLGVLFCRSNSCNVVKKLRCRCFGFFQFVRFILPTNTTGVGRLAGSHLNPFRHNVNITDNPPAFLK